METPISSSTEHALVNGVHTNGFDRDSLADLEQELPIVYDGQVPLGDVLSRVVQSIYAELSELAETMPNMSDTARKRTLADWVVKTKKQVVKLYAVVKWSRDADTVQKCMNITAFLMNQNQQFEDSIRGLNYAKESLDPARLRNHDLLTSLDVLTTGSYHGLPTGIKKMVIPPTPLTDAEVIKTMKDMEDVIRFRIRIHEILPVEMAKHRIANGRVYFTVPDLFETSLCLKGGLKEDSWFFVHVEFLITVGGDLTDIQNFPRTPEGNMKQYITDEANSQLMFYEPLPVDHIPPPGVTFPPRPQLPAGVVDTPLVRLFNFLQIMSLSYQLEILWYQAERMRSLGWADYLSVNMSENRKSFTASYWLRPAATNTYGRPRAKLPLLGGTLTISIVEAKHASQTRGPARSPKARVLAELQHRAKLDTSRASDEVEGLKFEVRWEPAKGALGVVISPEIPDDFLFINATDLNFESLLKKVLQKHTHEILSIFQYQLQRSQQQSVFSGPGIVSLTMDEQLEVLRVNLCADEVVLVTLDSRSGLFSIRDTGDLAAAERGPRYKTLSDQINQDPTLLFTVLIRLRLITITDLAEQKAVYLGLQSFRRRNFLPEEMTKLGPTARGAIYIQLSNFPNHYLVLVITDKEFRYALITTAVLPGTMYGNLVMEDIAWLDFDRIHGGDITIAAHSDPPSRPPPNARDIVDTTPTEKAQAGFNLDTQVLRELYSYCCARVSYINVERQFKIRGIPFIHVNPTLHDPITPELAHIQSSLARSVPALCVESKDILSGAPAAEAAMPNIRVIPLNWWSDKNAQVVTCVKLKYVQQPMGKTAGTSSVIRPSKRIIYDTTEAVVSFVSENVNTCVDEFLEEWARVSKMVVIAREVAQMSKEKKWPDIRLLSFDLQTVAFAYVSVGSMAVNCELLVLTALKDYTVSISCEDQLSTGGNFDLRFSRCEPNADNFNPHDDAEPFLRNILRHGQGRLAPSLHRLVTFLRETLPIAVELEEIRQQSQGAVDTFAKAAGWYRLLFGDSKHALDFRLMTKQRVLILDGSHSLFSTGSVQQSEDNSDQLGLLPIPRFSEIVSEVVKKMLVSGAASPGKIAPLSTGVICQTDIVRTLGRAIYKAVVDAPS
ncbi:Mediator of RNA polymerase II transcription subunit 14 [Mycena sanguinolenta]|uniref:Mediator of RNA polymerase II transcription subunit 14 n=1 Tax=Mycena sanguinolenta TaxID=230812 RepID=A0A8H6ZFI2_9AGAR|nr:Mediator of RNA polymerase II transcription subunit 14 [Mycena sanguinolenta]